MQTSLYDLKPLWSMLALGGTISAGFIAFWWLRNRQATVHHRAFKLTALVLFFTFDLVVFGAFTRLTDSGLGCPDWPGCYGHASPVGAKVHIDAAVQAMPTGPVTHEKAWIEMIHRYMATVVGVLLIVLCLHAWKYAPTQRIWATVSLIWVLIQGAFGALTVTLKLMPLIVTLHLLGGLILLALLTIQLAKWTVFPNMSRVQRIRVRRWAALLSILVFIQIALGGWVSTNYAVLACNEFPTCLNGLWWPEMSFAHGFELLRPLGRSSDGETLLTANALTAIHMSHRVGALLVFVATLILCAVLKNQGMRRFAVVFMVLLVLQILTGISNVVFQWPLVAALLHTAGAALWVMSLVWLWMFMNGSNSVNGQSSEKVAAFRSQFL